jgi:capsid protein
VMMALARRVLKLPASRFQEYVDSVVWQPRGWTWVDPLKDVEAEIAALGACVTTLADVCAARGKDWRDVIDQQAVEYEYAKSKGVTLNYSRPKPANIGVEPEDQTEPNAPPPPKQPVDPSAALLLEQGASPEGVVQ